MNFLILPASATTIYLKDGRVVEGDIIQKASYYTIIQVNGFPNKYFNDEIEKIMEPWQEEEAVMEEVIIDYSKFEHIFKEKVDLIVQLVKVSGIAHNMQANIQRVIKKAPKDRRLEMENLFDISGVIEAIIPVYNNYYTEEEIKKLIQFYESPVGKKLLEVTPKIIVESAKASIEYFQNKVNLSLEEE